MKRISWIDIARGLGILFVIYAHALNSQSIRFFFYSFHMPLFFFLSGIVFHVKAHEGFLTFIKKSAKNLLIPYVIFAYLSYLLWFFTINQTNFSQHDYVQQLIHLLYGSGKDKYFIFNNILWFLPCLFVTRVLFAALTRLFATTKLLLLVLFLFSIIGYALTKIHPHLMLPFGAEIALNAVVFYGGGYLWQKESQTIEKKFGKFALPLFALTLLLCIVLSTFTYSLYHSQIDMRMSRLHNYFLFYMSAWCGIISISFLGMLLKRNKILEYLGRSTLPLFAWHLIIFTYLTKILQQFLEPTEISRMGNTILAPLYSIFAIGCILFLYALYQNLKEVVKKRLFATSELPPSS